MSSALFQNLIKPDTSDTKYFGYLLPKTDRRYLNASFRKQGYAYNTFIGNFAELYSYYDPMLVIVKVTIEPNSTPVNETDFVKMINEIRESHAIYRTENTGHINDYLTKKAYKFEYFMIKYTYDIEMYDKVYSITDNLSFEDSAEQLLNAIGNYINNGFSRSVSSNHYRAFNIADISLKIRYQDTTVTAILHDRCIAGGLFEYIRNKCIHSVSHFTDTELFNRCLCTDNYVMNTDSHFAFNHLDTSYNVTYDSSIAYGKLSIFESLSLYDVIGGKLVCYQCPSHFKKLEQSQSLLYWFAQEQYKKLSYLIRIDNYFKLLGRTEIVKLDIKLTIPRNMVFNYTFYVNHIIKQALLTPNKDGILTFGYIDYILEIIKTHNDTQLCYTNHLEEQNKIIFNDNAYGIYNPSLPDVDIPTEQLSDTVDITQRLNNKLNSVFPNMANMLTMLPFSYQKRNIIWMNDIEQRVLAGQHKITVPVADIINKFDSMRFSGEPLTKYELFNDEYYYPKNYDSQQLYLNKNNCLDQTFTLSGGFICDDVGLGKTFSTISHIVNQLATDAAHSNTWDLNNCVIVPSRLLQQWKFEIEKYTLPKTLNVVTLGSITDIKKLYKKGADGVLYMPVKYDIYIISVNLINNKNYASYIVDNYEKNPESYNVNTHFDIFRIRWNRLIIDEVHERIKSTYNWGDEKYCNGRDNATMQKTDREITYGLTFNICSNFRWGLSATPFKNTTNNIIGYICWQAKELKHNLTGNVLALLYGHVRNHPTDLELFNKSQKLYVNSFHILPCFINPDNLNQFQKQCFTKTTKRFVRGELNIPIFTEEIKEIELGQIERNIYNNARADNSVTRHTAHIDRLKRLFQLCTNICISDVDIENLGLNADGNMTLEQLNKAMIKNFEKQLNATKTELEREQSSGPSFEQKKGLAKRLKDYIETCIDPTISNEMESYTGQRIKYFIEACSSNSGYAHGIQVTDIDMIVMKNLRRDLYSRLLECNDNMDNLFIIVSEIMGTNPSGVKPDWNDTKVLMITYYLVSSFYSKASQNSKDTQENIIKLEREIVRLQNQIKLFQSNDFIKEKTTDPCIICWAEYEPESKIAVTDCRHIFCGVCFKAMGASKSSFPCPECRADVNCKKIKIISMNELNEPEKPVEPVQESFADWKTECISKYGSKMAVLIEYLRELISDESKNNRAIVFSQYDNMLKLIGKTLNEYKISNVYCKGNVHTINKNIDKFKRDSSIRVIMLSSEHSNSGSNLTEASHIILVDVLNMDKAQTKEVECQAIGRAVRLGQQKPVTVVRLITKNTVESEYYNKNKYDIANIQ